MNIGDRVKYSEYALRPKRDYWQSCGREPYKSNAKRGFDAACAIRGMITAILPKDHHLPKDAQSSNCRGIEVTEDNGTVHQSLTYMWEMTP